MREEEEEKEEVGAGMGGGGGGAGEKRSGREGLCVMLFGAGGAQGLLPGWETTPSRCKP